MKRYAIKKPRIVRKREKIRDAMTQPDPYCWVEEANERMYEADMRSYEAFCIEEQREAKLEALLEKWGAR